LNRVVKFIGSLVFFILSRLWSALCVVLKGKRRGTCVVLYYHAVLRQHRELFARQMDMLLRYSVPTSADRSEPLALGRRYAAVTFDDGYECILENALPELEKRRIPSTIFVVTEALGKFPFWLSDPSQPLRGERIMSLDQLRALPPDFATVGSHTLHHPKLTAMDGDDARRELAESRAWLRRVLNREVGLFSFPYGIHSPNLVQCCRDAGYGRVFTITPTLAFSGPNEFVTGRVSVEPTDWPLEFRLKLLGAYRWLPLAFSMKKRALSVWNGLGTALGRSRPTNPNSQDASVHSFASRAQSPPEKQN